MDKSGFLNDVLTLQKEYARLRKAGMTKKNMVNLVKPFAEKYGFRDSEALRYARSEVSFPEIVDHYNKLS